MSLLCPQPCPANQSGIGINYGDLICMGTCATGEVALWLNIATITQPLYSQFGNDSFPNCNSLYKDYLPAVFNSNSTRGFNIFSTTKPTGEPVLYGDHVNFQDPETGAILLFDTSYKSNACCPYGSQITCDPAQIFSLYYIWSIEEFSEKSQFAISSFANKSNGSPVLYSDYIFLKSDLYKPNPKDTCIASIKYTSDSDMSCKKGKLSLCDEFPCLKDLTCGNYMNAYFEHKLSICLQNADVNLPIYLPWPGPQLSPFQFFQTTVTTAPYVQPILNCQPTSTLTNPNIGKELQSTAPVSIAAAAATATASTSVSGENSMTLFYILLVLFIIIGILILLCIFYSARK